MIPRILFQSFALMPHMTMLGIQQVPEPLVGAGISQTLMLSLSMVVIASMIAVDGLEQMVLRGIGRLDMGETATGKSGEEIGERRGCKRSNFAENLQILHVRQK